jgi:nucleotide-binding universal stress UspA family protein
MKGGIMPKTIIVPLDGSPFAERALLPAYALARRSGATPVLVMARPGGLPEPESYLVSAAISAGIERVETEVFDDRLAPAAVLTLAETEPDPLVCMATHARGGLGEALLGSVAESVILRGDTPMVLVGPKCSGRDRQAFEEVVVCLDGSQLGDAILPVVMVLARDLGLAVWLVTVVDPLAASGAGGVTGEDFTEPARLQHLARYLGDPVVNVNWEVLHSDDPASAIADFAATRRSPLIAMTTHGRTGLSRITTGSVAMSVVHQAECPVLMTHSRSPEDSNEEK